MLKHLRSKTLMTFSLIVMFLFSMTGTALAYGGTTTQTASPPYDYMAVGDSVPWGFIPSLEAGAPFYGVSGDSYADVIADEEHLGSNLGKYTDDTYTYPGMPTKALLAALTPHRNGTTVTVEGVTVTLPNYSAVMRDLRNSEIITITVGADDIWFLPAVKEYIKDPTSTSKLYAAQAAVLKQLPKTGANLSMIIGIMKAANPKARIYVMGYYNAIPGNPLVAPLIQLLNATIYSSVRTYRYSQVAPEYIDTWEAVTVPGNLYALPTGGYDIHVNPAGQAEIAELFWEAIQDDFGL
jgi:lysophospholipase L1-like esterase